MWETDFKVYNIFSYTVGIFIFYEKFYLFFIIYKEVTFKTTTMLIGIPNKTVCARCTLVFLSLKNKKPEVFLIYVAMTNMHIILHFFKM